MASYLASDPDVALASILFTKSPLLVYASKDLIALVDASSLNLVRTLAIWDAYPAIYGTDESVQHIAVDATNKWIIATFNSKIAVWFLSGIEENTWRVHSTLTVSRPVTAVACHAGRLVVATDEQLSLYAIEVVHDLPAWALQWHKRTKRPTQIAFSPSATVFATRSSENSDVCVWLTDTGNLVQVIRHPRLIVHLAWRSQPSSSDQYVLYTTTSDAALRIFYPVLDAPRHLQLHATVDPYSFLPSSLANNSGSPVFPLSREHLRVVVGNVLRKPRDRSSFDESQRRRLTELHEEGWDLFARVLDDGSIVIRAVANLDRRPPTLPKQFTLLHSLFNPPLERFPNELVLIPSKTQLILITSPPTASHSLVPLPFFDARRDGLQTTCIAPVFGKYCYLPIQRISRSPDGHAVAIMRDGAAEVWKVKSSGGLQLLREFPTAKDAHVLVFHSGESIAVHDPRQKTLSVRFGDLEPLTTSIPSLTGLFLIPPNHSSLTCLIGITEIFEILQIHVMHPPDPSVTIHSISSLPKGCNPAMIMPVDPMVWKTPATEVLLSISGEGDLEFWAVDSSVGWKRTGRVRTNRKNIARARCSSTKKTVLVVHGSMGDEVSIWDSFESQFSSGLEYCETYKPDNPVLDFDWTATPDGQSILSVGFSHHILLLYQQRMTYFDQEPGWGVFRRIEIENLSRHPIADSLWISQGQLLTGTGHQLLQIKPGSSVTVDSPSKAEDLFETVVRRNGPLPDYHPQMLLQCLLWEKNELVKQIIARLARGLKYLTPEERAAFELPSLPIEAFLEGEDSSLNKTSQRQKNTPSLFDDHEADTDEDGGFSRPIVTKLIEELEEVPLRSLSENENEQLLVFLQTALDIDEHRRALDADGLRYVISIRAFYLLNERILGPRRTLNTPNSPENRRGLRERIRYRDMVWAFHSTSQEVLLNISTVACGGKMQWSDARALGVFLWLNSTETLKNQFEVIARNQYMAGEERDPTACCLFYFALGKVRLVLGLWRQAAWHPEQSVMLKFLANDFDQPRWKTAALKNAFALLGKRRYEMAAAFFLLGGSLKDAVNVCLKHLNDIQLAVALARVVEGDDGPMFSDLLKTTVIPTAFKEGNRWLGLWGFWKLNRRDLSVRILVTPLKVYAAALEREGFQILETAESNYDDPSLALMFSRLKSVSLQTIKGSSMIPGQQEFEFVLQIARVFCRMGCHALALDLVTSWSFDPPELTHDRTFSFGPTNNTAGTRSISPGPPSPSLRRSKSRRRSMLLIDMDLDGDAATPDSPSTSKILQPHLPSVPETKELEVPDTPAEGAPVRGRTGIGSLMQTAKRDVQVPEFDMGAFF